MTKLYKLNHTSRPLGPTTYVLVRAETIHDAIEAAHAQHYDVCFGASIPDRPIHAEETLIEA